VREHIREGKHGARSTRKAIAIGLSKACRAGVKLPPPPGGKQEPKATNRKPSPTRSRAALADLEREGWRSPRRCRNIPVAASGKGGREPCRARPGRPSVSREPPEEAPRLKKLYAPGRGVNLVANLVAEVRIERPCLGEGYSVAQISWRLLDPAASQTSSGDTPNARKPEKFGTYRKRRL
jgi:hypothetical protein